MAKVISKESEKLEAASKNDELLFSFEFIVESVSDLSVECTAPAVGFRLLDFPTVIIYHTNQQKVESLRLLEEYDKIGVNDKADMSVVNSVFPDLRENDRSFRFMKGKSSLFSMQFERLLTLLPSVPLYVVLLDVYRSQTRIVGSCSMPLESVVDEMKQKIMNDGPHSATYCKRLFNINLFSLIGTKIGLLKGKITLFSYGNSLNKHLLPKTPINQTEIPMYLGQKDRIEMPFHRAPDLSKFEKSKSIEKIVKQIRKCNKSTETDQELKYHKAYLKHSTEMFPKECAVNDDKIFYSDMKSSKHTVITDTNERYSEYNVDSGTINPPPLFYCSENADPYPETSLVKSTSLLSVSSNSSTAKNISGMAKSSNLTKGNLLAQEQYGKVQTKSPADDLYFSMSNPHDQWPSSEVHSDEEDDILSAKNFQCKEQVDSDSLDDYKELSEYQIGANPRKKPQASRYSKSDSKSHVDLISNTEAVSSNQKMVKKGENERKLKKAKDFRAKKGNLFIKQHDDKISNRNMRNVLKPKRDKVKISSDTSRSHIVKGKRHGQSAMRKNNLKHGQLHQGQERSKLHDEKIEDFNDNSFNEVKNELDQGRMMSRSPLSLEICMPSTIGSNTSLDSPESHTDGSTHSEALDAGVGHSGIYSPQPLGKKWTGLDDLSNMKQSIDLMQTGKESIETGISSRQLSPLQTDRRDMESVIEVPNSIEGKSPSPKYSFESDFHSESDVVSPRGKQNAGIDSPHSHISNRSSNARTYPSDIQSSSTTTSKSMVDKTSKAKSPTSSRSDSQNCSRATENSRGSISVLSKPVMSAHSPTTSRSLRTKPRNTYQSNDEITHSIDVSELSYCSDSQDALPIDAP